MVVYVQCNSICIKGVIADIDTVVAVPLIYQDLVSICNYKNGYIFIYHDVWAYQRFCRCFMSRIVLLSEYDVHVYRRIITLCIITCIYTVYTCVNLFWVHTVLQDQT